MAKLARAIVSSTTVLAACSDPAVSPAPTGALSQSDFATAPTRQWRLPPALDEISGLAVSADGLLFAHDDEHAIIYVLDPAVGRLKSTFAVGAPETGDFEGLAITPRGVFWLVTSAGEMLTFREGEGGGRVAFERFDTGLHGVCEVEGLAYLSADESLILACKRMDADSMHDQIGLYAWRPGAEATLWRTLRESDIEEAASVTQFQPSSVEIEAATGDFLVLSGSDGAVARFSADGTLRAAWPLSAEHAQAEGLTLLPDGRLVIADEGARGRALLSIYERRHD